MENYHLSWSYLLLSILLLVGFYFFLLLLSGLVGRAHFLGKWQGRADQALRFLLRIYEPVGLIILTVIFILVNPVVNGPLVALLVLLGYQPTRNYISGRIFLLTNDLRAGQRISIQNFTGVIQRTERLGILLQCPEGLRFVNYSSLLNDGFVLLKGERVGGLHQLRLFPQEEAPKNREQILRNRLFSCPYVDWSFRPELSLAEGEKPYYDLRILVREEQHLGQLVGLIKEWGYTCELAVSN